MDETEIRVELAKVLAKEPNNCSKIIELSSKLASYDNDNTRIQLMQV